MYPLLLCGVLRKDTSLSNVLSLDFNTCALSFRSWCSGAGERSKLLVDEVLGEDLECRRIGAKGADMQFQQSSQHEIPSRPGNVVGLIEGAPAVVGAKSTEGYHTVANRKDAKERDLLAHRDLEVPTGIGG